MILPDELIREILSCLPVKSLVRFQSVCKTWKSFISDPSFVNSHLQRSPKNTDFILTFEDDTSYDNDDIDTFAVPCSIRSFMENPTRTIAQHSCFRLNDGYWVCGSGNGLVCLRRERDGDGFKDYWVQFWNPATRIRSENSPCLRVDSRTHPYDSDRFGFGYDDSCETYKAVVVHLDSESREMEFEVFKMGDICWRKILSCHAFPFLDQCDGKFLSGTLNWLALRRFDSCYSWNTLTINELVIFSLDVRNETYKHLLLPDGLDQVPREEPGLGVLMDCLCLYYDYKMSHFVVWQMKEFGVEKSWTQLVNVSYQHLGIEMHPIHLLLLLCMNENGDDILLTYTDNMEAILYNRRDNRAQSFEVRNNTYWLNGDDYVQSLVLPC